MVELKSGTMMTSCKSSQWQRNVKQRYIIKKEWCLYAYARTVAPLLSLPTSALDSAQHDNKTCKLPKFGGRHINSTFVMTPPPPHSPPTSSTLGFNMGCSGGGGWGGAARVQRLEMVSLAECPIQFFERAPDVPLALLPTNATAATFPALR